MYTRAAASDYDEWEEKFKNPGWGSEDLIPLLKKVRACGCMVPEPRSTPTVQVETYEVAPDHDSVHGYSGPLKVSYGGAFTNIGKNFLEVGPKYDSKRGTTDDPNDLFHVDVFGVCHFVLVPWCALDHADFLCP